MTENNDLPSGTPNPENQPAAAPEAQAAQTTPQSDIPATTPNVVGQTPEFRSATPAAGVTQGADESHNSATPAANEAATNATFTNAGQDQPTQQFNNQQPTRIAPWTRNDLPSPLKAEPYPAADTQAQPALDNSGLAHPDPQTYSQPAPAATATAAGPTPGSAYANYGQVPPPPAQDQSAWHDGTNPPPVASETAPTKGKKTPWFALVAVAVIAALCASVTTGLIVSRTSDDQAQSSPTSSTTEIGSKSDSSVEVPVSSSNNSDPDWQAVSAAVAPSVVSISVTSSEGEGVGSGVIVDADGLVLTNDHVVGSSEEVTVTLYDGRMYEAELVGTDSTTDLAVVRLVDAPDDLKAAVFGDSDEVKVGDPVMAMGNPLGLSNTATTGIVSALNRPVSTAASTTDWTASETVVTNAIQIDAAVNPGNSGGPLFNSQGEVIGITSSIATLSGSDSTSGSIGLGFAIPSNLADLIGSQLIDSGSAKHAFLGVSLTDATAKVDGSTRQGAKVEQVVADSPAEKAGIEVGDVIVAIDSDSVSSAESLTAYVRAKASGTQVVLTIVRDGEKLDTNVTLAVKEDTVTTDQDGSGSQGSDQDGSQDGSSQDGNNGQQPNGDSSDQGDQGSGGQSGDSEQWPGPDFNPWGEN